MSVLTAERLRKIVENPFGYIERFLKIRDMAGNLIPLRANSIQRRHYQKKQEAMHSGRAGRFLVLKSRRVGITTWEQAESYVLVATRPHRNAITLAHDRDSTLMIHRIIDLFHQENDSRIRPRRLTERNKRDLNYPDLRSLLYVGTAGGKAGRADTLQRVHGSEVAWWPGDLFTQRNLLAGLTEAAREGEIVLESTPNGVGGLFYELWDKAKRGDSEWVPLFYPWWEDDRNRLEGDEEAHAVVESYSDEEKHLVKAWRLVPEQIEWRRWKMRQPEMQGGIFSQEYPEDDVSCFLVSGTTWFDMTIVTALLAVVPPPLEVRRGGEIEIYEAPREQDDYVIGADVGEGLTERNFSVGGVLNRRSQKQAAVIGCRMDPGTFAHELAKLGKEYKTGDTPALIAVERNNHGHSVLNTLKNTIHYPRIFRMREYDATRRKMLKLGFETTKSSKPILLQDLREAVQTGAMEVGDRTFLSETRTFVSLGDGKYGTKTKEDFDDRILAWGIALQACRSSQAGPGASNTYDPAGITMSKRIYKGSRKRIF